MTVADLGMQREEIRQLVERWPLAKDIAEENDHLGTVVVAGAYKGVVCQLAVEYWGASLVAGFEPQGWAFVQAQSRLSLYTPNVELFPFGIGTETAMVTLGEYGTDACSMVNTGPGARSWGEGFVLDAEHARRLIQSQAIDLLVLNLEGYEFELLPYMLPIFEPRRLAVQFHFGVGGEDQRYDEVQELLQRMGYTLTHDYRPSWEYWGL